MPSHKRRSGFQPTTQPTTCDVLYVPSRQGCAGALVGGFCDNFRFADKPPSIKFAARGRSICIARLGSLLCMEQGVAVEDGSVQNYGVNLARVCDVDRRIGCKNQQVRSSSGLHEAEFMPCEPVRVVAGSRRQRFPWSKAQAN